MSENIKGIILASLIVGLSLIVCATMVTSGLGDLQKSAFGFIGTQKHVVRNYLDSQKCEARKILSMQKKEVKETAKRRESKLRTLIREELKNANIDIKTQPAQ